jgi:hypothetical protein
MKRQSKLISQHQAEEQQAEAQQTNSEAIREFSTPEELLRHDARNTVVPDSVTRRLRESLDVTRHELLFGNGRGGHRSRAAWCDSAAGAPCP